MRELADSVDAEDPERSERVPETLVEDIDHIRAILARATGPQLSNAYAETT